MGIKIGDTIRVKEVGVNHPAPDRYLAFVGKEFVVKTSPSTNGVAVGTGFFYFDEIEIVRPVKSLFEFGQYNEKIKDRFLAYLDGKQCTGICSATNEYAFVVAEIDKTGYNKKYPIEHAISKKNHKKRSAIHLKKLYESQRTWDANNLIITGMNSPSTPYGKLRRWWAYNLAVAVSKQDVEVAEVTEDPKEPEFDSNIILTAKNGDKITLDGIEFILKSMRNDKVFLESHPVDGYETVSSTYPYLHVRNSQTRVATFRRENLKELIDSKNYTIS